MKSCKTIVGVYADVFKQADGAASAQEVLIVHTLKPKTRNAAGLLRWKKTRHERHRATGACEKK